MSKTIVALVGIIILSAGIQGLWSAPRQENPAVLLRAAIEKEEVDGDLNAAIEQYKRIIKIAGADRAVAAQALLRLGGCYEKRGPEEARQAYQQLIRDYAEQSKAVAAARQRLAALSTGSTARAGASRLSIRRVPDLDMYAKPSPDGKYLAFTDWKTGNLAVLDVATGTTRQLTKDGALSQETRYAEPAVWSRDGQWIAFLWGSVDASGEKYELRVLPVVGEGRPRTVAMPVGTWIGPLDWSPDGSRVLCSYASSGRSGLAFVNVSDGALEKLDVTFGSVADWTASLVTGDGRAVLFSAPAGVPSSPSDVFSRDLRTGATTPVVQHPAEDLLLGVLPGTDWLLFASDRRGSLDLWAVAFGAGAADLEPILVKQGLGRAYPLGMTNDGRFYYATISATDDVYVADVSPESRGIATEPRKLRTRWDGSSAHARFSPDGANLAYVVRRSRRPLPMRSFDSLVVQSWKNDNAEPVVVAFDELGLGDISFPRWLPGGKSLVVRGGASRQSTGLYRVGLPDLRKRKIYAPPEGYRVTHYDSAPSEAALYVVISSTYQPPRQPDVVFRIDADGGGSRELYRPPIGQRLSSIAVSPDGTTLSMVNRLDLTRREVLVMPATGGESRRIFEFKQPSGAWPAHDWTRDGRFIEFVDGPLDGKFYLRKIRADVANTEPETTYQLGQQFYGLSYHPDGRLVAFTACNTASANSEVWVMENLREEIKLLTTPAKRP
jgi:Tol biopolymer transport system component